MSELSFSRAIRPHFSIRLLLSNSMLLFSFIVSHPLYFSYLVFFSPYIFKPLSFLSPFFITTFLLLPALLTFSPTLFLSPESSDSNLGSLLDKCGSALLRSPVVDDGPCEDFQCLEELQAYKIVFEADSFEVRRGERQPMEMESEEKHCLPAFEGGTSAVKTDQNVAEEKRVIVMMEEQGEEGEKVKEKKVVKAVGARYSKVDGQKEMVTGGVSEGTGRKIGETPLSVAPANGGDYTSKAADDSQRLTASVEREGDSCYYYYSSPIKEMDSPARLVTFGSMRIEKEWKRTLACKLFEERHKVDGSEGMDLLWETYEADSSKVVNAKHDGKKKSSITKKKEEAGSAAGYNSPEEEDGEKEEEEEEEEEEGMDKQLCCLQALKFSAGKIRRPNLQKISKALKGFGWLHQVSKHGKKAHHH